MTAEKNLYKSVQFQMKWFRRCLITGLVALSLGLLWVLIQIQYTFPFSSTYSVYMVEVSSPVFETDDRFLSLALDTSFMKCLFHKLNDSDWKRLEELSGLLSPAYLRLGGTDADLVLFDLDGDTANLERIEEYCNSNATSPDHLIITGRDWIKINEFAKKSNLSFIFDLNVLLRNRTGWNSTNARNLIEFSAANGFPLDFQLGNEPNSFEHVFNVSLSGYQLAKDFNVLKKLLNSSDVYSKSKLIGPDVTRPKNLDVPSLDYLREFLSRTNSVDVASWHQYYLNGRTAQLKDFVNPETLNVLPRQIHAVSSVVREFSQDLPIWISETSSAYGNGAPGLSDRYAAIFLWLDKLGVSARSGISVVIRQSLWKGNYALIDQEFSPSPDFWISFFYKKLVGKRVLNITTGAKVEEVTPTLRLYSHCSNLKKFGNVVVFGENLSNATKKVIIHGFKINYPINSYVFTPENQNLTSKSIYLNGKKLIYNGTSIYDLLSKPERVRFPLRLPGYSVAFWLLHGVNVKVCRTD